MTLIANAYYEDIEDGREYITDGRTITEADIVNFAGVSGDFYPLHMDVEYAAKTPFKQRVAHGLCVMSIMSGSVVRSGILAQTFAFYGIEKWRFLKPVFINDTIHVSLIPNRVSGKAKADRALVKFDLFFINQKGETVQDGTWNVMLKRNNAK